MSKYNAFTNHPLIPNSQEYMVVRKYVSIHSQDRDVFKYPNSAEFEIELPQDYLNVLSVRLESWSFSSNYSTFSNVNKNITMSFQITNTNSPSVHSDFIYYMYQAVYNNIQQTYSITIEEGHYTPQQMVTELTNKFNAAVTNYIYTYFTNTDNNIPSNYITQLTAIGGGYSDFVIVYNEVTQKIWFGNKNATFILLNIDTNSAYIKDELNDTITENPSFISSPYPPSKTQLHEHTNWGLASYLGLPRTPVTSTPTRIFPRFYYGDVVPGDDGYWLRPSTVDCSLNYIESEFKINIDGPKYFYMDVAQLNNIDETNPYNLLKVVEWHTNETNSRVNSSFAKIAIPYKSDLCVQCFETNRAYKIYNPPAERIRKIKLRMRHHTGQLVDFGGTDYSFTLEFTLYNAQQSKKYNNYIPENNIFT